MCRELLQAHYNIANKQITKLSIGKKVFRQVRGWCSLEQRETVNLNGASIYASVVVT